MIYQKSSQEFPNQDHHWDSFFKNYQLSVSKTKIIINWHLLRISKPGLSINHQKSPKLRSLLTMLYWELLQKALKPKSSLQIIYQKLSRELSNPSLSSKVSLTNISKFLTLLHVALICLFPIFLTRCLNVFGVWKIVFCLKQLSWLVVTFQTLSDISYKRFLYKTLMCKEWCDG